MQTEKLKEILERQKGVLQELETEYRYIEQNDLNKENETLRKELEKLKADYMQYKEKNKDLEVENKALKNTLYEQIYNEKVSILNISKRRVDAFFGITVEAEQNRLTNLERAFRTRIEEMTLKLRRNNVDLNDEIYSKIFELNTVLDERLTSLRIEANKNIASFAEMKAAEYESIEKEELTDEVIKEVAKKNNIESFIGLNLVNKLGMLLIVIGVIVASRYTFFVLSDILKCIFIFILGGLMLVGGEILSRKKANVFSMGLTAGGVATLYIGLVASYFGFNILSMYPAIGLCVLITSGAFVLSTRHNAQVILVFALLGGYLPMFSLIERTMVYASMIYFVILNLFALLISFKKKWSFSSFTGLLLNTFGNVYMLSRLYGETDIKLKILSIAYVFFAFLTYTIIPIAGTYFQKLRFKKRDCVLIAINTFFSSIIMYLVFYMLDLEDYYGLLAIIYAVSYLFLGRLLEKKFEREKIVTALFYLTGLTFVVLVVPIQFGSAWLSLGWLVEGVCIASYGILNCEKSFKRTGFVICALCLSSFILFDVIDSYRYVYLFNYKYLAITLGSLIVLGCFVYKKTMSGLFERVYKYLTVVNLWFFIAYICNDVMYKEFEKFNEFNRSYLTNALIIALTFLFAYFIPRIAVLGDRVIKIISACLYGLGIFTLFNINSNINLYAKLPELSRSTTVIGTIILIAISVFSILAVFDFMKHLIIETKISVEFLPLVVSGYFLLVLTHNLIENFNLSFSNAILSIIYVVVAFLWIIFGFAKRYAFLS